MTSVAVFVDAGYLFAQGSVAQTGETLPRSRLQINATAVVAALKRVALEKSEGGRLLRIYWYDGSSSGRLSLEQSDLANTDDIKLRLGQINSVGQQKGVDSLIVTDLIELARNRAVGDALLLSGDEDVRIGVQIAQSYGVRVHLLGIGGGKQSQSRDLIQEADTTTLWTKADIDNFLSVIPTHVIVSSANTATCIQSLSDVADRLATELEDTQLNSLAEYRTRNRGVPPEFDGRLLGKARDFLGRDLDANEKKNIRSRFIEAVKLRKPSLFSE